MFWFAHDCRLNSAKPICSLISRQLTTNKTLSSLQSKGNIQMAGSLKTSTAAASGSRSCLSTSPRAHTNIDHAVPSRQKLSHRDMPPDTPNLAVRWYFATDVPKSKPFVGKNWQPPKPPSKFIPFSAKDSRNIEVAYQQHGMTVPDMVAVNEDRLFQVNIHKREISPIYWLGPAYDVRRGTWFYAESSTLKPCDENLANQIEEGYLKIQPFKKSTGTVPVSGEATGNQEATAVPPLDPAIPSSISTTDRLLEPDGDLHNRASSFTDSIASAFTFRSRSRSTSKPGTTTPSRSVSRDPPNVTSGPAPPLPQNLETWPLYGPHMGKYVVYSNDASYAWIISDDFYGKFASTVYQRLTAGASMGGIKIVRGWSDVKQKTTAKSSASGQNGAEADRKSTVAAEAESTTAGVADQTVKLVHTIQASTVTEIKGETTEVQEEKDNAILEEQMEQEYNPDEYGDQDREIEHVVLCIHGIGQKLGQRIESVNFVGDVNAFRKTVKSVYLDALDLQALNGQAEDDPKKKNSKIQVLPVCWRHNIHFGLQQEENADGTTKFRKEQDIGDLNDDGTDKQSDSETATLQDITVDGVPALRGIISEVLLDILLYYQPNYRERIMRSVTSECNRIYKLFRRWNPDFNGKISIAGHSLGAAISFDILCRQPESTTQIRKSADADKLTLDFNVDSFFGLGSPVGLFQMLKGKTIAPRSLQVQDERPISPLDFDIDNPFEANPQSIKTVSKPKVEDVYNIFHPADPISYRLEPLVVKRMAELKPQPIPSTRRGLNTQIANIAELTQRVAQGASNMWSSMASGLASTILNKSLGYDTETSDSSAPAHNIATEGSTSLPIDPMASFRQELAATMHNPTDPQVETLYSRFQKESSKLTKAAEDYARLQRDEELIRGLNYTGRLDFALPEGYMDITLLASMGSHLGYFRDPDVANFVMGQLLSRPYPKQLKSAKLKKEKYRSI
ncbi:DDHD domain-containing protein [Lipomyces arxii]|uniref:DDHD domain-containing protein n=1 Tax=Lipomyces arxii TaxID=56418 RepID=UPI0034CD7628